MVNLWKKLHGFRHATSNSCFPNETLTALGAADVDFAAASGDTDSLLAAGAAEIPMLLVLQMVEEIDKRRVLPASGLQITGVHAEDTGKQGNIGDKTEKRQLFSKYGTQDHQRETADEQRHIQFIGAVTAQHKITKPVANSSEHQITC